MKNTIMKYKDEAIKILSDLISFETVLDEYNPLSDAPFGEENKKALHYLLNLAEIKNSPKPISISDSGLFTATSVIELNDMKVNFYKY